MEAGLEDYVRLMTANQGRIRAFVVSLMPGCPDVDDVVQETNAVLWLKRNRFEEGTNFLAWAFKIARYEVMRQRERTRRLERAQFSEELLERLAQDPPIERADSRMTALESCLTKLSDSQRAIVKARYTPGHSLESYASDSGSSPGSVRMALLRIREALKRCVERTLQEETA